MQAGYGYVRENSQVAAMEEQLGTNGSGSHGNTVERLIDGLRDGIMNSRYAPGQRLIEADLTREFRVSRGPLREAFRRLSAEGLLEIVPNRGALVRRLSYKETIELFQVRTALETLAVRLAAEAIDEGDNRARFERAIQPIWDPAPRTLGAGYHEENRQFHQAILNVCGNVQLAGISHQLQLPLIMLQLSGAMKPEMYNDSVTEHRAIARAILDGDADSAERALRSHLKRATEIAETMPPSTFRG